MSQPTPSLPPTPPPTGHTLWDRFRSSPVFPVASIILVGVIILGLGFAVVGLVKQLAGGSKLAAVKGPSNVAYKVAGNSELKLSVLKVAYQNTYNDGKPLAPDRKFVVVNFAITNSGTGPSAPFTNEDMRLITADGSIMPPAGWSKDFLNYGVGVGETKKGEVVFDIDPRNAQHPLSEFKIAFGKNPGNRAMYSLTP